MKMKSMICASICGILCAVIQFFLIPTFLMKGITDAIWVVLMLILPAAVAFLLLRKHELRYILVSTAVHCLIALIFADSIGKMIGYHLGNIMDDLFDYIGYLFYAFGWIGGATMVQFLILFLVKKTCK